jgi:hypothetical protein
MSGISPGLVRLFPDFWWFGEGRANFHRCDYFIRRAG